MTDSRRRGRRAATVAAVLTAALTTGSLPVSAASAAVPAAPQDLAPHDASSAQHKNLELRWSAVPGATGYEVQLSDDGRFGAGTLTAKTSLPRWTAPVVLPRGDYAWRVRALSPSGTGAWSAEGLFTRGWHDAPAHPVTHAGAGLLPALSWTPMPDASFYEVELSRVPFDAGDAPYEATLEHYTCYTNHTYLAVYGVMAGAENPPGNESACAFGVGRAEEPQAPEEGEEPSPAAGPYALDGTFVTGQTYYWRVRGRDGTVDQRETPFAQPAVSCTGVWLESGVEASADGKTTLPVGGEPPAYDPLPECSNWREGGHFTVPLALGSPDRPGVPAGLSVEPTAGDAAAAVVTVTDTPLFRWDAVAGAAKYRVHVSRTADLRDADHVWETYTNSIMPLGTMADRNLKRYWSVQACSFHDLCSDPAPAKAFVKTTKVTTAPLSTASDDRQVLLTWSTQYDDTVAVNQRVPGAPAAQAYQLQVALDGNFGEPAVDVTLDRVADRGDVATSRHAMDVRELPDGLYRWRVRPVDEAGQSLPWSATTGSFRRDRAAPTVRLTSKAGFGLASGVVLTFSEPVTGVTASSVGVRVSGGPQVSGKLAKHGGNGWLFTPSTPWVAGEFYDAWVGGTVRDLAGKKATVVSTRNRAATEVDSASPALRKYVADYPWTTRTASDAIGRSYVHSSDNPRTGRRSAVYTTVRGSKVYVFGCRGPASGHAEMRVDGKLRGTVDLYQSYSSCGRIWVSPTLANAQHQVTVTVAGKKRSASKGYTVAVDAIRVS